MALHMHLVMVLFVLLRLNMPIALVCMIKTPSHNASTKEQDVASLPTDNASFVSGELGSVERNGSAEDISPAISTTVQNDAVVTVWRGVSPLFICSFGLRYLILSFVVS